MSLRRRRPLRRRPGVIRGRPLRRAAMKQLRIANHLFEDEQWLAAAKQYERLATAAVHRGVPQAPQLMLRAAQARLKNGDHAASLAHLTKAVDLFAQFGQYQRLYQIRPRVVEELKRHGLEREAVELDQIIHTILDQHAGADRPVIHTDEAVRFPPKCTSCGANLRPDEMELIDSKTSACAYCGSVNIAE